MGICALPCPLSPVPRGAGHGPQHRCPSRLWSPPITSSTHWGKAQLAPRCWSCLYFVQGITDGLVQREGRWPSGLLIKWTRTELGTKINTASTQISNTCVTLPRQKSNYFKMIFTITLASSIEHQRWQLWLSAASSPQKPVTVLLQHQGWAPLPSHSSAITHTSIMKILIK